MPILFFIFCFFSLSICAQFNYGAFENKNDTLPYRIIIPKDYSPAKSYPILIFLHGSGERGNDNEAQLIHGSKIMGSSNFQSTYNSFVVFPQCGSNDYWANIPFWKKTNKKRFVFSKELSKNNMLNAVLDLIESLESRYSIDSSRRYIGGLSMGGMGTIELIAQKPNFFAAAFAICGGGHPSWASKIKNTPLWLLHGTDDDVVNVKFSKKLARKLIRLNSDTKLTLYPNTKHNSWSLAFKEAELFSWLFSK
ncbi:MAG: prolyl oligopeptidase family serine peptidase [Flavobacteriaceae bacterium]|nr:prolyl oligopeptidase family serine peptidase [Flavobacteriaceae bacterium]